MNDRKLQQAMDATNKALEEVEAKFIDKFPGDLFEDTLKMSEDRLSKMQQENAHELDMARSQVRNCEARDVEIMRYMRAIHAAKTELTRPGERP